MLLLAMNQFIHFFPLLRFRNLLFPPRSLVPLPLPLPSVVEVEVGADCVFATLLDLLLPLVVVVVVGLLPLAVFGCFVADLELVPLEVPSPLAVSEEHPPEVVSCVFLVSDLAPLPVETVFDTRVVLLAAVVDLPLVAALKECFSLPSWLHH